MVAPLFVTALVHPEIASTFSIPFLLIGAGTVVVFILFLVMGKRITPETPYADMTEMRSRARENPAEIFKTKPAWAILIAGITYFALQIGIGIWLPTYFQQQRGASYQESGLMLTLFYVGALAMRFLTPLFLRKMKAKHMFTIFGLLSCACIAAALLSSNMALTTAFIMAGGFFQGAHAPLLVIMCCDTFPKRTGSASALISISNGIASLTFPVLMGAMAETMGFQVPLFLIVGTCIASSLIIFFLGRKITL